MKWFIGVLLLLVVALIFDLSLLAYAMYALLAVLLVSRFLSRSWINNLQATREIDRLEANVGETVTVGVNVRNTGWLPVVWLQMRMRDIARGAAEVGALPRRFWRYFWLWFAIGVPALVLFLGIFWLMVAKPA